MATAPAGSETIYQDALVNYLTSMARSVEGSVQKSLLALEQRGDPHAAELASQVFLHEPRINEMEIVIDDHAVRMLRRGNLSEGEIRLIVASLKLTNDLERMGDLAVNISERVISLAQLPTVEPPEELAPMISAVRAMMNKALGGLIFRNVVLATTVLESDDVVDKFRDRLSERLLAGMTADPRLIAANFQFVLATRYLERIADHATNIAEDTIFWVRGLDVRHGRTLTPPAATLPAHPPAVTENSSARDTAETPSS
jgi:phosphate transport system protein